MVAGGVWAGVFILDRAGLALDIGCLLGVVVIQLGIEQLHKHRGSWGGGSAVFKAASVGECWRGRPGLIRAKIL